jgi:hypothetical protein
MAMKRQAQITGQVNPDLAPIVAESLADTREKNYRDAVIGLQEQSGTLAQRKQAAQEAQFATEMAQRGGQFDTSTAERGRQFDTSIAERGRQFDTSTAEKGRQFNATNSQQNQQFADELAFKQSLVNDEMSQADRMRRNDWLKLGLGGALAGVYMYADPYNLRRK